MTYSLKDFSQKRHVTPPRETGNVGTAPADIAERMRADGMTEEEILRLVGRIDQEEAS